MPIDYDDEPQKSFTPYPQDILPEGFRYPENYLLIHGLWITPKLSYGGL